MKEGPGTMLAVSPQIMECFLLGKGARVGKWVLFSRLNTYMLPYAAQSTMTAELTASFMSS